MALTPHSVLRVRLVGYLASVGGSARRRDVLEALDAAYGGLWTGNDLLPQTTRKFESKWRNRVSFERQRMVEAGLLEPRADGVWALTPSGQSLAGSLQASGAILLDSEVSRREKLWDAIREGGQSARVSPNAVREAGLYAGARGIYVDVAQTRSDLAPHGIALTFLDLGVRYSNEVSGTGVMYHFPKSERPGRDAAEIAAARRAFELGVPVFVVTLAAGEPQMRAVHRAYIEEIDEPGASALITFAGDEELPPPPTADSPFKLTETEDERWGRRRARPNQARFAFKVFQRYGAACVACGLSVRSALEAAHVRSKATAGSDDERNGLPLCSNHHRMYDAFLWAIEPEAMEFVPRSGFSLTDLAITRGGLRRGRAPHADALGHAWQVWHRKNRIEASA